MQKERVHTVRSSKSWSTGEGGAGQARVAGVEMAVVRSAVRVRVRGEG